MKTSWIIGIVFVFMISSFFVHGVVEQNATPISQDIMDNIATLSQPEIQNNPLAAIALGVGTVCLVFIQMLLDLFMPSLYVGTFIYVWLFMWIAIIVGIVMTIVFIIRGVGGS